MLTSACPPCSVHWVPNRTWGAHSTWHQLQTAHRKDVAALAVVDDVAGAVQPALAAAHGRPGEGREGEQRRRARRQQKAAAAAAASPRPRSPLRRLLGRGDDQPATALGTTAASGSAGRGEELRRHRSELAGALSGGSRGADTRSAAGGLLGGRPVSLGGLPCKMRSR